MDNLAPMQLNILTNATANGVGVAPETADYHHLHLQIAATTQAASGATIKVFGSYSDVRPSFAVAPSLTNQHFPVSVKNLDTVANINGSTGIVLGASATLIQGYMVNTDKLKWLAVEVSGVTGTVNISVRVDGAGNV